jgi:hypothetical protein
MHMRECELGILEETHLFVQEKLAVDIRRM